MKKPLLVAALLLAFTQLTACGLKGPLYLPKEPASVPAQSSSGQKPAPEPSQPVLADQEQTGTDQP